MSDLPRLIQPVSSFAASKASPSSPLKTKGRPPLSRQKRLEYLVVKLAREAKQLRRKLDQSLEKQYPKIDDQQRLQVVHTILAVSEEYRLWAELDNALLAVQRSKAWHQTLEQKLPELKNNYRQIVAIYSLHLNHLGIPYPRVNENTCLSHFDFDTARHYDITTMTVYLAKYLQHVHQQWQELIDISHLKSIRENLRTALKLMRNHRVGVAFNPSLPRNVGRGSIPLPVLYLRAEQQLLDAFHELNEIYHNNQQPYRSLSELCQQTKNPSDAGRPRLSLQQKIDNQILRVKKRLANELELGAGEPCEPLQTKGRGRKPLTHRQKIQRLQETLNELNQKRAELGN